MEGEVDAGGDVVLVGDLGEEERVAFRVELEDAGELVFRRVGDLITALFPLADEALFDQRVEGVAQFRDAGAGEFEAAGELGLGERVSFCGAEGVENGISQIYAGHGGSLLSVGLSRNGKGGAEAGLSVFEPRFPVIRMATGVHDGKNLHHFVFYTVDHHIGKSVCFYPAALAIEATRHQRIV